VSSRQFTTRSFADELPRLLRERNESVRGLAREVGGIDHAYLSRMISREAPVNSEHAKRIARYLGLPPDYFPEVRETAVIAAIKARPRLRDEIYFNRIGKRRR
jgi:plasmid maintenance system antidote protein VapI